MKLLELFNESVSFDYKPGVKPANDTMLPHNFKVIATAVQEYIDKGETPSIAAGIIADEFNIDPHKVIDAWYATYRKDIQENRNATQVAITDNGHRYLYWVTPSKPETAIRHALKKHRNRFGYGMKAGGKFINDKALHAEIVGKLHDEPIIEPEIAEPMPDMSNIDPDIKYV
jgi:hypothetical protein